MSAGRIRLCHRSDVPKGTARGFLPAAHSTKHVIVVNRDVGFNAYMDSCPHYRGGTPMAWRKDAYLTADKTQLMCSAHGALFDIDTGACTSGPCLGRKLTRVHLEQDASGYLTVPAQVAGRSPREN